MVNDCVLETYPEAEVAKVNEEYDGKAQEADPPAVIVKVAEYEADPEIDTVAVEAKALLEAQSTAVTGIGLG